MFALFSFTVLKINYKTIILFSFYFLILEICAGNTENNLKIGDENEIWKQSKHAQALIELHLSFVLNQIAERSIHTLTAL